MFHDDQHGTAIISSAGLINACYITGRELQDVKLVLVGAGAAGIASLELMKALGVRSENSSLCDNKGVIHRGRDDLNQWKSAHAMETDAAHPGRGHGRRGRGAGPVGQGRDHQGHGHVHGARSDHLRHGQPRPGNHAPKKWPSVRDDAIMATGRSDYPNQVNNVLGFPYIFRGALDVRARRVNHEMKLAAAYALAELAREDVPDEVAAAYHGRQLKFGPEYIIPTPFDPRLIWYVPPFIAKAAMDTGVARKPIADMDAYRAGLAQRLDPAAAFTQKVTAAVKGAAKKRIVFAEGEDATVIRAAYAFQNQGLGEAILVGRETLIHQNMALAGIDPQTSGLEIINARLSDHNADYVDHLYKRMQRNGYLIRDAQRLINLDRNSFAAAMLAFGHADGMVTGVTRNFDRCLTEVLRVIDPSPGGRVMGMIVLLTRERTLFIADTNVTEMPDANDMVEIAIEAAGAVEPPGLSRRAWRSCPTPPSASRRASGRSACARRCS